MEVTGKWVATRAIGVAILCVVAWSCSAPALVDVVAERVAVDLVVRPDGGLRVIERWVIAGGEDALARFEREAPASGHDGVAEFAIERGAAPATPEGRIAHVSYLVEGAVAARGMRGLLEWPVLNAPRPRTINQIQLRLRLPAGSLMLEMPAVAEAGWTVSQLGDGMEAYRRDVPPDDRARIAVEFSIEGLPIERPRWHFEQERAGEFAPAFISAGLFILVVGLGIVAMLHVRFGASASALASEAERSIDRVRAVDGLRRSGIVAILGGIAVTVATARMPGGFGVWSYSVGVSVLLVGVIFVVAARVFRAR